MAHMVEDIPIVLMFGCTLVFSVWLIRQSLAAINRFRAGVVACIAIAGHCAALLVTALLWLIQGRLFNPSESWLIGLAVYETGALGSSCFVCLIYAYSAAGNTAPREENGDEA